MNTQENTVNLYYKQLDFYLKNGDISYFYILDKLMKNFSYNMDMSGQDPHYFFDLFAPHIFKVEYKLSVLNNNLNTFLTYGSKFGINKTKLHGTINSILINSLHKAAYLESTDKNKFVNNLFQVCLQNGINFKKEVFNESYEEDVMNIVKIKFDNFKNKKTEEDEPVSSQKLKM